MAKHILHSHEDDLDFVLIGLSSQENQYAVVSSVNDILNIHLFLSEYIPFHLKEGKIFRFSLYCFSDEELGLDYFFIPNTSNFEEPNINTISTNDLFAGMNVDERVKLIKELPKTDYFLILKGEDLHNYQFKIIEKLKSQSDFIQIQAIEPQDLPSKRNLIF